MKAATESLTLVENTSHRVTVRPPAPEAAALSVAPPASLPPRVTVRILEPEPVRFSIAPTLSLPVAQGPNVSAQRYAPMQVRRANLLDVYI